jgi:hypothetical protein
MKFPQFFLVHVLLFLFLRQEKKMKLIKKKVQEINSFACPAQRDIAVAPM